MALHSADMPTTLEDDPILSIPVLQPVSDFSSTRAMCLSKLSLVQQIATIYQDIAENDERQIEKSTSSEGLLKKKFSGWIHGLLYAMSTSALRELIADRDLLETVCDQAKGFTLHCECYSFYYLPNY